MPPRKYVSLAIVAIIVFFGFSFLLTSTRSLDEPFDIGAPLSASVLRGEATAAKLENATLKAELGNAAWKLLHTTMAKFPDDPTPEDRASLKTYVYLFARLYPCGDCARHFQKILKKYPPQVSSRSSAATWACHVHNEVNKRLKKELFDCTKIGDSYDCGCGGDAAKTAAATLKNDIRSEHFTPLHLVPDDGLIRGG